MEKKLHIKKKKPPQREASGTAKMDPHLSCVLGLGRKRTLILVPARRGSTGELSKVKKIEDALRQGKVTSTVTRANLRDRGRRQLWKGGKLKRKELTVGGKDEKERGEHGFACVCTHKLSKRSGYS